MRSPQVRAQSFSPSIRLSATFTGLASNRFGLQFEVQPHPVTPALYVISIRRTRDLPTDFFSVSGFLQISPHDGHPCLRLYAWHD